MAANKFSAAVRRLKAVATKEVRQLSRDRVTFGMIVGVPLMQIILFGYAINYDVRNLATVVQDDANSSMSREFIAQLKATQVVHVQLHHELLRRARAAHARGPRQHGGGDPARISNAACKPTRARWCRSWSMDRNPSSPW